MGTLVGVIRTSDVRFDPTRRKLIGDEAFTKIRSGDDG
jgi:hypothetical protein